MSIFRKKYIMLYQELDFNKDLSLKGWNRYPLRIFTNCQSNEKLNLIRKINFTSFD